MGSARHGSIAFSHLVGSDTVALMELHPLAQRFAETIPMLDESVAWVGLATLRE